MTIRTILADDHKMVLAGLRALLEGEADIAVVGEAGDGMSLLALVEQMEHDVVVVDIGMPGMTGIEATRRLLALRPLTRVIALSAYTEKRFVLEMLEAGAKGYLIKASAADELPRAIRAIAQGQTYLCPEVAGTLVEAARRTLSDDDRSTPKLGKREREVLSLLAEGLMSSEIAKRMHVAEGTVEAHRRNIMRKLDLHTVAELTRYAIREGLISP